MPHKKSLGSIKGAGSGRKSGTGQKSIKGAGSGRKSGTGQRSIKGQSSKAGKPTKKK